MKIIAFQIIPVTRKNDDLDRKNYRSVSVLSHVSKVFEGLCAIKGDNFVKDRLSHLLTGFRKNHITQKCLTCTLEMWIAKLEAYGFEREWLSFMKSYLSDRQQLQVHVNNNCSSWEKIITGVPKRSILGSHLFNICINYFASSFYLNNCADDNTLF